jgi:hypothetical protein
MRKFDFEHSIQLIFLLLVDGNTNGNSLVFEDAFYLCKNIQKHLLRKLLAVGEREEDGK